MIYQPMFLATIIFSVADISEHKDDCVSKEISRTSALMLSLGYNVINIQFIHLHIVTNEALVSALKFSVEWSRSLFNDMPMYTKYV